MEGELEHGGKARSSSDKAYEELRAQILDGILKAGTPLKERDLCARLGISRTPVREALRRLSADGLVDTAPRRSIRVAQIPPEQLKEIYEVGGVLQTFATGLAAEKATRDDVIELEQMVERMEELLQGAPADLARSYAKLDQIFHDRISQIARNSRIAQIIRQAVDLRLLVNVMDRYRPEDFRASLVDHREIVDAIARRDVRRARDIVARHVGQTGR